LAESNFLNSDLHFDRLKKTNIVPEEALSRPCTSDRRGCLELILRKCWQQLSYFV